MSSLLDKLSSQFAAVFSDFWIFITPLDLLFGENSSTAFLVQCLLMLSESSSVFSYLPFLHPTQHHWQKPKLNSC